MAFSIYIQLAISSLIVVEMASSGEINQRDLDSAAKIVSFIFSLGILWLCVLFIIWTIYKWFKARTVNAIGSFIYSKYVFDGLKANNISRFNTSKHLLQHFTLWIIAVFWGNLVYFLKISIYWLIWFFNLVS